MVLIAIVTGIINQLTTSGAPHCTRWNIHCQVYCHVRLLEGGHQQFLLGTFCLAMEIWVGAEALRTGWIRFSQVATSNVLYPSISHMLHGAGIFTYMYFTPKMACFVGKYSSTMEHMGMSFSISVEN